MKEIIKANLKRLERLVEIRDTYVSAAEAGVKLAEGELRRLQAAESDVAKSILNAQKEIAFMQTSTGHEVQTGERYIHALANQRKAILNSVEEAAAALEQRRREWTEAMREQKITSRLQNRRLRQAERETIVDQQKSQDEAFIARYVRRRMEER
jgi:flagellar export protein FliJ